MFLDPLIKLIKAPLELVRSRLFGISSVKGGIKGDVRRLKDAAGEYKGAAKGGMAAAQGAGAKVKAAGAGGQVRPGKPNSRGRKMGLFSKKKKCSSCGQRLHESWDQCPYCGAGEAAAGGAPAPAGKMRTMAIATDGAVAPGGGGMGWLVPLEGPQSGELFELKGRAVVGTAADCDVVMRDPSISGRHAEFLAGRGGFRVNDLGSTNGTFVNDKRVTSSDLIDNDNVRLGRTNFKFKSMS